MPIDISAETIKDIAENLEMGMNCWYNVKTGKLLTAPDRYKNFDIDDEIWEEVFSEIESGMDESIRFSGLKSHEEFKIMESFVEDEVSNPADRSKLFYALNQRKPFMQFKSAIHYDNVYLEKWYAYRLNWYINHVSQELAYYNSNIDSVNNLK